VNEQTAGDIAALLFDAVRAHGVAGAALAVVVDGEVTEFAAGVADCRTREPMRTDTLCLIGSTTKVYTATLLMQLATSGRVSLDAPVRRYLPDFRLADADATADLTVRHLLAHSTGIGVGSYTGYGCEDDAVARYVASLATQPSVHPPGERWGYSNAAYIIAGRIVEVVTGLPWDVAVRRRLLDPAGLFLSRTSPEELLLLPVAKPHLRHADGRLEIAGQWGACGRSRGPSGSTLATSAGDFAAREQRRRGRRRPSAGSGHRRCDAGSTDERSGQLAAG
jgi:CubicO group peptidase (beta-lactamase class C family)